MKKFLSMALVVWIMLASPGSLSAATEGTASVRVTSDGTLSVSIDDAAFEDVPYSFDETSTESTVVVKVEDNRGTGAGWKISLHGSDFVNDDGASFDISNLALTAGTATTTAGQDVSGITTSGVTVSGDSSEVVIASAQQSAGMGHYTIEYPATLHVPGGTLVGDYKSTLTVDVATGP